MGNPSLYHEPGRFQNEWKRQSADNHTKMPEILELSDKDFKAMKKYFNKQFKNAYNNWKNKNKNKTESKEQKI